jgi:predicted DNA-binding ribbon-helix-helix protein
MAVTPLIKPIQDKRGIFYNFQSALEDINITITNSETAVRFSKFALLRLPEIGVPNTLATDNKIQFQALGETPISISPDADNNINLANSFQNYALNLEALLISEPGYQRSSKLTVAERVFWKWLKEIGAIRFQDANAIEKNVANLPSDTTGFRFVEKPETLSTYNRVVKYIGEIDVVNSISSNDNAYTEVYIHVPTNVGTTPHVLFKSIEDQNYGPNRIIANTAANPLDVEYLAGRHFNDPAHPFGLSSLAFYDLDDASVTAEIKDLIGDAYSPGNWFNQPIVNSYYTDLTANYHIAKDQFIRKTKDATTIEYQRNTLDGISIDFNLANYKLASENQEIKVFSQFNDYVANRDFEFNAILVYYDTYDPNNLDQNGNPIEFETNLYGILILDKVQTSGLEFKIPTVTKYRPNPLNKTNGNSFSFKMNLKIDTSVEDTKVEKSINDFIKSIDDLYKNNQYYLLLKLTRD